MSFQTKLRGRVERWRSEAVADEHGLTGVLIAYGDPAMQWGIRTTVAPGALTVWDEGLVNIQHYDHLPVAKFDTEYVAFADASDAMRMSLKYPANPGGEAVRQFIDTGVLEGLSMEIMVHKESWTYDEEDSEKDSRLITKATLIGVGVVSTPAFDKSRFDAFRFQRPADAKIEDLKKLHLYS